ncbi:MAG TPA: FtsX-like permease family protein, partial [Micromonosporaceae bacterium]|nr:FtsX-like permease family protein [Micromonosporaceae bacterium]
VDRRTGRVTVIAVATVWRPSRPAEPYWLLTPGVAEGVGAGSATYGPIVVPRQDFLRGYAASASAAWLAEPHLVGAGLTGLAPVAPAARDAVANLPDRTGLGSSALVTSELDVLVERLRRADLVGRSTLVTPVLLMAVMAGYALLLVAGLLTRHRRAETALLRVRGAGRGQLAALAAREAALIVLPAAVLAPPLAGLLLRYADTLPLLAGGGLRIGPRLDAPTWLAALAVATACALAMVVPALRKDSGYAIEVAEAARPRRHAAAQRAGLDLALVALALLGWVQLRQYSSPLTSAGIDPLLAVTPTLAVVAGAVLALRLLPPFTGLAERVVDRGRSVATTLGMWQAGRRPQAGTVLLITLAVAASTVAWSLLDTSERSLTDQADHAVGADLRLVESSRFAPAERWDQVAGLPGVERALPVWRDTERLGADAVPTAMVALDAEAGAEVVRLRPDLADHGPAALFAGLARERPTAPGWPVPAGTRRISGTVEAGVAEDPWATVRTYALVTAAGGGHRRLPLAVTRAGAPLRFDVALPADLGGTRLVGFAAETAAPAGSTVRWSLTGVEAGGPVRLPADARWRGLDLGSGGGVPVDLTAAGMSVTLSADEGSFFTPVVPVRIAITAVPAARQDVLVVPVVATPRALDVLRVDVGERTRVSLGQGDFDVVVTGTVAAVPTVGDSALLADLPSLAAALFAQYGTVRDPQEWWLATRPGADGEAAAAAAGLRQVEVQDRRALADRSGQDPYGAGTRAALFAAAVGAILIAALTISVGLRANARRRVGEYAVLRAFGAGPRLLIRSLVAEQALLAGGGTLAGLAVGAAVAAAVAPLIILTPTATRPVPEPLVEVASLPVVASAATLFLVVVALSALVATTTRRDLVAARVRMEAEL